MNEELKDLIESMQDSFTKRLERLELLFSPTLRNPGHTHVYPAGNISYFNTTGTNIAIATQSDGSTNMVLANPTTTFDADSRYFDSPSAGRLRYIGTSTEHFFIGCAVSVGAVGTNDITVYGIAKNGTVLAPSKSLSKIDVAADTRSTALNGFTTLNPGDYLELYVGNVSSADDLVVKTLSLFALGFHY